MTVQRLALAVFLMFVFIPAAPVMAQSDDPVAADAAVAPAAEVAQETTPEPPPEEPPAEEDPDEEEFGEEIPEEPVPEEEPEPEVEEEPPPAPVAAPAQELPRTGTDTRIFAIAGLALLMGLALRRATRTR